MLTATHMPAEVNVEAVAEAAIQAAFGKIAELLEADGYPVTGDFGPGEVFTLERQFAEYVRAMALNNERIAALNEEV